MRVNVTAFFVAYFLHFRLDRLWWIAGTCLWKAGRARKFVFGREKRKDFRIRNTGWYISWKLRVIFHALSANLHFLFVYFSLACYLNLGERVAKFVYYISSFSCTSSQSVILVSITCWWNFSDAFREIITFLHFCASIIT